MNGHTLGDLTAYYEALPASALELALFLEADRMASLSVSEENLRNQVDVVKEEIRVNVLNRPYGGFPWIPCPRWPSPPTPMPTTAMAISPISRKPPSARARTSTPPSTARPTPCWRWWAAAPPTRSSPWPSATSARSGGGVCPSGPVARAPAEHRPATGSSPTPWPPSPRSPSATGRPTPSATWTGTSSTTSSPRVLAGGDSSRLRARLIYRDNNVTDVSCQLGTFGDDAFFVRDPTLLQVIVFHPGTATTSPCSRPSTKR